MKGGSQQPPQAPMVPMNIPMPGADQAGGQLPPMQITPPQQQVHNGPGAGLAATFDNPGGALQPQPGETAEQRRKREMMIRMLMSGASGSKQPQYQAMAPISLAGARR